MEYFNFLFLFFLLGINLSFSITINKKTNLNSAVSEIPDDSCELLTSNFNNNNATEAIVSNTLLISNEHMDKYYFLFFSNRRDNFNVLKQLAKGVNMFFSENIEIKFYCKDQLITKEVNLDSNHNNKFDETTNYVIKSGKVIETKRIDYLSEGYLDYLFKEFNLTQIVDHKAEENIKSNKQILLQIQSLKSLKSLKEQMKKLDSTNIRPSFLEINTKVKYVDPNESKFPVYNLNLIQSSIKADSLTKLDKGYFILVEQSNNRFIRFVWAMLIVIVSSMACFVFIKSSVDWATSSQTELNKLKMSGLEEISREVKAKYSYIVNTEA